MAIFYAQRKKNEEEGKEDQIITTVALQHRNLAPPIHPLPITTNHHNSNTKSTQNQWKSNQNKLKPILNPTQNQTKT